mgnify:CR=1 FL=1|tara:strand:+ start:466 stop:900 length:435 start_codon:yes stop_codon:yes gene_type:complete
MNIFDKIEVLSPEYNFFRELSNLDKIHYLLEIYDIELKRNSNLVDGLSKFFNEIDTPDQNFEFESLHFGDNQSNNRVDVMIDSENIVIESNSLKAVRLITYKFIDSGYLLKRDSNVEKLFRKDKITRYLRVYKIIGQSSCLCYN